MARKLGIAVLSAALISGVINVSPAAAKISNGTACSKAGAMTTVSGYKYRCAKNTLVKNSKLTWLSFECVAALKDYQSAIRARTAASDLTSQLVVLKAAFDKSSAQLAETNKVYDAYRLSITELRDKMNLSTSPDEKLSLSKELTTRNQNLLKLSKSRSELSAAVIKLETDIGALSSAPKTFSQAVTQSKILAAALCEKGV
jgi:hypothetical protein